MSDPGPNHVNLARLQTEKPKRYTGKRVNDDETREWITKAVLIAAGIFVAVLTVASFVPCFGTPASVPQLELLKTVWSNLVAFVTLVLGFYFGSKSR